MVKCIEVTKGYVGKKNRCFAKILTLICEVFSYRTALVDNLTKQSIQEKFFIRKLLFELYTIFDMFEVKIIVQ